MEEVLEGLMALAVAGGSGYVYTSSTASNYPSGCTLNSSYYLTSAQTVAGNSSFPSTSGGTETGHSGDGYARITNLTPANQTGELQTFTAPATGVYQFDVAGAAGSGGNVYGGYIGTGGKGARIVAKFTLNKGDVVDLVVGKKGTCIQATAKDGTSGGGGGGSFVFKRISSVTNTNYQFTKGSINYETLLAVAGGGGSKDCGYTSANSTGYDGIGASYKSPNNYTAYSTSTCASTSSTTSVLGISQFITYDAAGAYYTRASRSSTRGLRAEELQLMIVMHLEAVGVVVELLDKPQVGH